MTISDISPTNPLLKLFPSVPITPILEPPIVDADKATVLNAVEGVIPVSPNPFT
jgi:hypothetical protein